MQRCASVIGALSTDTAACRRLNAALLGANPGGQRLEQVICSGKTTATGVQMQVTSLPISAVNQMLGVSVRFAKNIVITQNQMFDLSSEGIWIEQDDDPTALDWQDTITGFEISYNSLVNLGTSTTSVPRVIVLNTSGMRQLSDGGVHGNVIDNTANQSLMVGGIAFNSTSHYVSVCVWNNSIVPSTPNDYPGSGSPSLPPPVVRCMTDYG